MSANPCLENSETALRTCALRLDSKFGGTYGTLDAKVRLYRRARRWEDDAVPRTV